MQYSGLVFVFVICQQLPYNQCCVWMFHKADVKLSKSSRYSRHCALTVYIQPLLSLSLFSWNLTLCDGRRHWYCMWLVCFIQYVASEIPKHCKNDASLTVKAKKLPLKKLADFLGSATNNLSDYTIETFLNNCKQYHWPIKDKTLP